MKKLITFQMDEHDTFTLVFDLSEEALETLKQGREHLSRLGPSVEQLGLSWDLPVEYFEGVAGLKDLMDLDEDGDDPLKMQSVRLQMTREVLWFEARCKNCTLTTWGMSWTEFDGASSEEYVFNPSFIEIYGADIIADLDVSDLRGWDLTHVGQKDNPYMITHNGGIVRQGVKNPVVGWKFIVDKAAQGQVEQELHRAGIIEDPDMAGGLFG